jgi:pseudouridine synthase
MRLNRFLARSGIASRRGSDELIAAGQVRVNGAVVDTPGSQVSPGRDRVEVGGKPIDLPEDFEYVLLNKAAGCLVTRSDPQGRPTIYDRLPGLRPATVAVGRLDQDTTGALLLTDDGELAFRLTHPRFEVEKRYEAIVLGRPSEEAVARLCRGVELEDGVTAPARARLLWPERQMRGVLTRLELRLHEGRKHQVKRMCQAVGHRVRRLRRTDFAGLRVSGLAPGQWRHLQPGEVAQLASQVGLVGRG